jgi:hypothetical protein
MGDEARAWRYCVLVPERRSKYTGPSNTTTPPPLTNRWCTGERRNILEFGHGEVAFILYIMGGDVW